MMTEEQERHTRNYMECSTVEAIMFPFAFGRDNLPCLLVTSVAGGWRYTDVITPTGETSNLSMNQMCTADDPSNHQGDTCPIHEG